MTVQGTCRIFTAQDARAYIEQQPCYANRTAFDPREKTSTDLEPLSIEEYKSVYDSWKGDPLFKQQDGTLVQVLGVLLPQYPMRVVETAFLFSEPKLQLLAPLSPAAFKTNKLVTSTIFPNIKHHVGVALGNPITIDETERPPSGMLAKTRVKAFFSDPTSSDGFKFRYGNLMPLTYEECKLLPYWDGLPVFKDEEGNLVRPHVAAFKGTKALLVLVSPVQGTPIFGITINPYGKPPRSIPMLHEKDFSKKFEMIPLFGEKLAATIVPEEEKKD